MLEIVLNIHVKITKKERKLTENAGPLFDATTAWTSSFNFIESSQLATCGLTIGTLK